MKKTSTKLDILLYSIGVLLIIGLWWLLSIIINQPITILPTPIDTFKDLFRLLTLKYTYISILMSFAKMIIGYVISILLALLFGILAGINTNIEKILRPIIISLKAVPTVCIIFALFVMVGFEYAPAVIVMIISFPIIYESVLGGIKNIPTNVNEAMLLDSGNNIKSIFKIKLPLSFNYIIVGIASSFGLALKVEIMSEAIVGNTGYGIGSAIKAAYNSEISIVSLYSWTIIAIIILFIIHIISNIIKKYLRK